MSSRLIPPACGSPLTNLPTAMHQSLRSKLHISSLPDSWSTPTHSRAVYAAQEYSDYRCYSAIAWWIKQDFDRYRLFKVAKNDARLLSSNQRSRIIHPLMFGVPFPRSKPYCLIFL